MTHVSDLTKRELFRKAVEKSGPNICPCLKKTWDECYIIIPEQNKITLWYNDADHSTHIVSCEIKRSDIFLGKLMRANETIKSMGGDSRTPH